MYILVSLEMGHTSKACPEEVIETERTSIKCVNCDQEGHRARDCPVDRVDRFACRNCKYVQTTYPTIFEYANTTKGNLGIAPPNAPNPVQLKASSASVASKVCSTYPFREGDSLTTRSGPFRQRLSQLQRWTRMS